MKTPYDDVRHRKALALLMQMAMDTVGTPDEAGLRERLAKTAAPIESSPGTSPIEAMRPLEREIENRMDAGYPDLR